jgi:hypothetical protein
MDRLGQFFIFFGLSALILLTSSLTDIRPVQHNLATVTRIHDFEALLEFGGRQPMGDDRPDIQAALQHRRHFVPGLKHFPAIDALDG